MLATQTLIQRKAKNMRVRVDGALPEGVTAKDIILAIIGEIGTAGGTGHVIEYAGEAIQALSMEGRMTVCNMSIEGGARAGLIAPDQKTFDYIKGRPRAPKAGAFEMAQRDWERLYSDEDAVFDREVVLHAEKLPPLVTWGTSPEQVVSISGRVPVPSEIADETKRHAAERSLDYMGLKGGEKITDIALDRVFIGSCTNGRIEDLREVARIVEGRKVNANINAMIVPGSGLVKEQAEAEGLDKIFKAAGFEWREPGCSMCLGMNPDQLAPRERCASTSNRNFEGRQGQARPHPSRLAGDGGGRGACRPLRRHPRVSLNDWVKRQAPSLAEFEAIADAAYAKLPKPFRDMCGEVLIRIEDFPSDEVLDAMGIESPFDLLGLYHGVDLARQKRDGRDHPARHGVPLSPPDPRSLGRARGHAWANRHPCAGARDRPSFRPLRR